MKSHALWLNCIWAVTHNPGAKHSLLFLSVPPEKCGQKSLILRPKILDSAAKNPWLCGELCGDLGPFSAIIVRCSAENAAFCGKCGILRKMRRSAGKLKIRWTFIKMQAHVGQSTSCFSHIMFHLYNREQDDDVSATLSTCPVSK